MYKYIHIYIYTHIFLILFPWFHLDSPAIDVWCNFKWQKWTSSPWHLASFDDAKRCLTRFSLVGTAEELPSRPVCT